MRRYAYLLASLALPSPSMAQAARIGRLEPLSVPANGFVSCTATQAPSQLQAVGIARMLKWQDSSTDRLVSLSVDVGGKPKALTAVMTTRADRRDESESVTAFFGPDGNVVRGGHNAYATGTPARVSDDRRGGLLSTDTSKIQAIVRALSQQCPGRRTGYFGRWPRDGGLGTTW